METVVGLFSSAASGIGSAASSLFGAGAPAGASTGLGSTGLSVLQGAMGLGSAFSAIAQGAQSASSYRTQAALADASAEQERLAGMQRVTALKRELLKAVGESDVVYAASGVDIGSGVAQDARQAAKKRAVQEISVDRAQTDARIALEKAKAAGYRRLASGSVVSGLLGGATAGLKTAFDIYERG